MAMSTIEAGATAPSGRAIMVTACALALVNGILPVFAGGAYGDEIAPLSLALPAVVFALLLAAPEAFGVTHRRTGRRTPNVLPAFSVMGLIISAGHVGFLTWRPALTFAGFGAAIALVLGLGLVGKRLPGGIWLSALLWAGFGGAYGYGATVFADTTFDHDPGQIFRAQIEREYVSHSRSSSTPHLVLAPWGPVGRETDISVTNQTYHALAVGDAACVTLRPGALGMAWYRAAVCNPS
jgi:hypothetical protein